LQKTNSNGQTQCLEQDAFKARKEWKDPRQRGFAFRGLFERRRVIEECRIPRPLRFKFATGKFPQAACGIGHAHKLLI
jgi:hypothetical protein